NHDGLLTEEHGCHIYCSIGLIYLLVLFLKLAIYKTLFSLPRASRFDLNAFCLNLLSTCVAPTKLGPGILLPLQRLPIPKGTRLIFPLPIHQRLTSVHRTTSTSMKSLLGNLERLLNPS